MVEGIKRNNSVELFIIWVSGSGGDVVLIFLLRALAALLFGGAKPLMQF